MVGLAALVVLGLGAFTALHLRSAARAATRGRAALTRAEADLTARKLPETHQDLTEADQSFTKTQSDIGALGPVASVARLVPVVGTQVKAVDIFARSGLSLSRAAQPLVDAADTVLHPADDNVPISAAMDNLRTTQRSMGPAVAAITRASDDVAQLKGKFLIGPLARARDDLVRRLPRIQARATSADHGLAALIAFAGDSGPKRYLFLSQNPDEVRPTGGFIGTYGVLTADKGQLKLERYDAIENWTNAHPQADVPPQDVGSPFRYSDPPLRRSMANVNNVPDWPSVAQLAANLWKAGGEDPVDGVISFTPGFMGRVLAVVGPVTIPSYDEMVTAQNIDERLDFYTHEVAPPTGTNRKDFVAAVAETVMGKLLAAPASQWEPLAQAMGQAFDAKQALAWSSDPQVAAALAERHWDGSFPPSPGDFFFNSEFEYVAKNGRGIQRTYDHNVAINPDGSARVTTTLTVTNTQPPNINANGSTLAYMTLYGPQGAVLDDTATDAFGFKEPTLAGHPGTGWFRAAKPSGGQTTLTVVWNVPGMAQEQKDGTWRYNLTWLHLPDHTGDTVNLTVQLPPGRTWKSGGPPHQFSLDRDFSGSWAFSGG